MTVEPRLREQLRRTHQSLVDLLENPELESFIAPDQREVLTAGARELNILRAQLSVGAV